jgi:exodeoxyribonuclease VII small subunit
MGKKVLNYTTAIVELEAIVKEIEEGAVDVEILANKLQRASELIKFCNDRLKGARHEVDQILVELEDKEEK